MSMSIVTLFLTILNPNVSRFNSLCNFLKPIESTNIFLLFEVLRYFWSLVTSLFLNTSRLRWAGHVARMDEDRSAFKILSGKLFGRPRHRWENNIRMDLEQIDQCGKLD
jgi:hypothetical protein